MAVYIPVSQIVESTLINEGDNGMHKYQQRLEWVLRGVKKLNFDTLRNIKTVLLPMNDNRTVDLPIDCVSWTKVGVKQGDKLLELSQDRGNTPYPILNDDGGNPIADAHVYDRDQDIYASSGYGIYFANYRYPDGQNVGRIFGLGGGHNKVGYFKEWKERNQLVFTSLMDTQDIYLEYITNGMSATGETIIDSRAEEFLIRWVEYLKEYYAKTPIWQEAQRIAFVELELLKQRMHPFSVRDFMDSSRKSFKLSPKY